MLFSSWQSLEQLEMKILTLSNYFPNHPGGIEFVALNLVSRWRKKNKVRWVACDVVTPPHSGDIDDIPLAANNFTEARLGFPYPIPTGNWITTIVKEVQRSEIVHFHDCLYFANIITFLAAIVYSKPIVVTQHVGLVPYREMYKKVLQGIAYQTIGRLILKRSDEVVFINKHVKEWFERNINVQRTSLIHNGINREIFYPSGTKERESIRAKLGYAKNDILLLFIGRFTQKKGIHLIRDIARNCPNYHWIMIGSGEIDLLGRDLPNVRIFPPQPQTNLRDFYVAADLFVLPSTGEGFPLAVQEALACGLPAAVSEETAHSLKEAPLIRLNTSSLPQILETLDRILHEPTQSLLLQDRSKEFAKQWDWDLTARKYEDLFTSVVGRHSTLSNIQASIDRKD